MYTETALIYSQLAVAVHGCDVVVDSQAVHPLKIKLIFIVIFSENFSVIS